MFLLKKNFTGKSDEALLALVAKGQERAFELLYERRQKALFAQVTDGESPFASALSKYFDGKTDSATLARLPSAKT